MQKKQKSYQTPAATVVAISSGSMICQGSPMNVILATDILNSGSGNPLQDMGYNSVVDEDF